jgi:hypothetical protein
MNTLILQSKIRKGAENKHERHYLDFIISGQSLLDILGVSNLDFVTPLALDIHSNYEKELTEIIATKRKSNLESGRVMLYICPECGDFDCGAITVHIEVSDNKIIWKDFAYEDGIEGLVEKYSKIESIEFEVNEYNQAFSLV